jgi:hypothetical protein
MAWDGKEVITMKVYRISTYYEDEDGHSGETYCFSTLTKASESFKTRAQDVIDNVKEEIENYGDEGEEMPEYTWNETYFNIYRESGYFYYKMYIDYEEIDTEKIMPMTDKEFKEIIEAENKAAEEKEASRRYWPGQEVKNADL